MMQSARWKKQMWSALKMVAPGTALREGIENVLRAHTGGLIVLGDFEDVRKICQGGFHIEDEFNPSRLYELAKMDGAIILDERGKMIWRANVQLQPTVDDNVPETGIRHRIAARTAIQTGAIVIAISQRRSMITLYRGHDRFVFDETVNLMTKATQALQTLERYCIELQKDFSSLTFLEFEDNVLVNDVVKTVQRCEMVKRISEEIDFYLLQMGDDGFLIEMQKNELTGEVLEEYHDLLVDYSVKADRRSVSATEKKISEMNDGDLFDKIYLAKFLGFGAGNELLDAHVRPLGYRVLNQVPRLPHPIIGKIVEFFGRDFQRICEATVEELDEVEGVGRVRSNMIYRSLRRQKELAAITMGKITETPQAVAAAEVQKG